MNDLEKAYIGQIIERALRDGCVLSVHDGEDTPISCSRDKEAVLSHLGHCEHEWLIMHNNIGRNWIGQVFLVYGNEPDEVVNDYSWHRDTDGSRMQAIVGEYQA